jgi:ABC-type antimicrobial peptide transport system permease subunit
MSYLVSQRTREIGIRMAVGATSSNVIGMVLKRGLGLTAIGAVPGLLGAFAVGRLLESTLYGVDPADPWIFGGVVAGLGVVALLATAIPARKAANMGALEALRLQ